MNNHEKKVRTNTRYEPMVSEAPHGKGTKDYYKDEWAFWFGFTHLDHQGWHYTTSPDKDGRLSGASSRFQEARSPESR
jgi:hypothetical protein